VAKQWHLLMDMQALIEGGTKPNAAAETLADKHWSEVSVSQPAAVQWFKRNQRRFADKLKNAAWREKIVRMFERMGEKSQEDFDRWWSEQREQRGLTPGIALMDLERLLKERDRENPAWRARWRKRYGRNPDDMLTFFRELAQPEPEQDTDEETQRSH